MTHYPSEGRGFFSSLLFLAAVAAFATAVTGGSPHSLIRSSCSCTRFPDLCFSTLAADPSLVVSLTTQKDVIEASINHTIAAVEHNYFTVQKLAEQQGGEKTALHDCLEIIDETLDELRRTYDDLVSYPSKRPLSEQADDLKILLSAAMTNQETCLDGVSRDNESREALEKGLMNVYHLCSNSLAMVCNMTNADMAMNAEKNPDRVGGRGLKEDGFPRWLSAGDRRLLQSPSVAADVTVAADGSGEFRSIAAAVAAAPEKSRRRYVIRIKAGVYRENVEIPKKKTNLMFVGDNRRTTIIRGSRNVVDGSTTFKSATVAVVGEGFLARDLTFENTAGPSKGQAVALRVGSDHSAFFRCDILAYQDTLYVHSLRQFYRSCLVAGTVDFIFGNAAAVLQDCDLQARRPNPGQANMVTAQGRDDPNENTGIVIHACRVGAAADLLPVRSSVRTFLGRPWRQYSRTVVMKSEISDAIRPEGWSPWSGNFALDTLYYAEYQNTGAGAATGGRVRWKGFKVITSAGEAQQFTAGNFIAGSSWLGSTGFPFSLSL